MILISKNFWRKIGFIIGCTFLAQSSHEIYLVISNSIILSIIYLNYVNSPDDFFTMRKSAIRIFYLMLVLIIQMTVMAQKN